MLNEELRGEMARDRVIVENGIGYLYMQSGHLRSKQRHHDEAIGELFIVSAFLANVCSCIEGINPIAHRYSLSPPTVEEYLAGLGGYPPSTGGITFDDYMDVMVQMGVAVFDEDTGTFSHIPDPTNFDYGIDMNLNGADADNGDTSSSESDSDVSI